MGLGLDSLPVTRGPIDPGEVEPAAEFVVQADAPGLRFYIGVGLSLALLFIL